MNLSLKRGMASALICALMGLLGCESDDYARLYNAQPKAPSMDWEAIEVLDHLGPTVVDLGTNFGVWSERAERIDLLLFDDPESTQPAQQIEMTRYGDVWNAYVEGVGNGQHYGFVAWGPNWTYDEDWYPGSSLGFVGDVDGEGNRFNPNKLLTDPWAKAYHRPHDWGAGSAATGPWRDESTWAAASKSVVVTSDYEWSAHEAEWIQGRSDGTLEGHNWNELVIYEVHPKGFTQNTASGVAHPGTFRGFGEMAGYLEDLGVTAVELLPVFQKQGSDGGYWGYATLNFFAPEMDYSAAYELTGEPHEVLAEFQGMVDLLHQHGIEVILDVVFNHTGEGGLWREKVYYGPDPDEYYYVSWKELTGIYSFRGFDNAGWYAVTDDGQYFWDNTGVGHDVRANHAGMRRLIMDSLRYYVEELHVDGFRFDLAAILGEVDGDYDCWNPTDSVLQDIIDEPLFQERNIRVIAEPWSASGGYENCTGDSDDYLWALNGLYPSAESADGYAWAEWNNNFRDWWRRFVNQGTSWETTEGFIDGGGSLTGSNAIFGNDKRPYHSVNFVTVHDGFTLFDLFSFDEERNGCGPLNPVCCDDPYSTWCDIAGSGWGEHEVDWGDAATKRQLMRNMFAATLLSHGTPLILGGDEWMRTQYGNNNAYSQGADNSANWFRWGEWLNGSNYDGHRMHDFVRGMIALRKAHPKALSPSTYGGGLSLDWLASDGSTKSDWSDRHMAMHYTDDGSGEGDLLILINMESSDVAFSLPGGGSWSRVVDTQSYFDLPGNDDDSSGYFSDVLTADRYKSRNVTLDDPAAVSGSYTASAMSIVVLEGQ